MVSECPGDNEGSMCSTPEPSRQPPYLSATSHILTSNNNNYHTISYPTTVTMTTSPTNHDYQALQGHYASSNHSNSHILNNNPNRTSYSSAADRYHSVNGSKSFRESFYGGYCSPSAIAAPYTALNYHLQRGMPSSASPATTTIGVSSYTSTVTHAHSLANECVQTRTPTWSTSTKSALHRLGGATKGSNLRYPGVAIPKSVALMAARGHQLNSRARLKLTQRASSHQWTSSESEAEQKKPRSKSVTITKHLTPADNSDTTSPDSDGCSCGRVDNSNQSTFGSSDLPSDVSSYDSNVYRSRSPVETGHTQNEGKGPPPFPATRPFHLKPTCVVRTRTKPYPKHDSHRHSCHGNLTNLEPYLCDKASSKHTFVANPAENRLSQPTSGLHHNFTHNISIPHDSPNSSDFSISSLDTTGISPLVSDWGPSSGSDSNNETACSCKTKPPDGTVCMHDKYKDVYNKASGLQERMGDGQLSKMDLSPARLHLHKHMHSCHDNRGSHDSELTNSITGLPQSSLTSTGLSCKMCAALKVLPVGQRALSLVEAASEYAKRPLRNRASLLSNRRDGASNSGVSVSRDLHALLELRSLLMPTRRESPTQEQDGMPRSITKPPGVTGVDITQPPDVTANSSPGGTPSLGVSPAARAALLNQQNRSREASPRRSIVLFTEPQGQFISYNHLFLNK